MLSKKIFLLLLMFVGITMQTTATVALPYFFSSGMVLQQQTDAAIWGKAVTGSKIVVTTSWDKKKYNIIADIEGKWRVFVKTPLAGGPYTITISDGTPVVLSDVLIGEVWLCSGQSNMEMPMKGYRDQPVAGGNDFIFSTNNNHLRLFTVPRAANTAVQDTIKKSSWQIANSETIANFSATASFFASYLQKKMNVPVGLVNISYGGTPVEAWMSADVLGKNFSDVQLPGINHDKPKPQTPTVLFNAMLHPFIGYSIKGCIWYQGESNCGNAGTYQALFSAMVSNWRQLFNQGDFPFYYVQIAPFNYQTFGANSANSAYLRDAQRKALSTIPNSDMIVILDAGDAVNIHPANKEMVGKRLAYAALNNTYNYKGFTGSSPVYEGFSEKNDTLTLKFSNVANGFTSYGKKIELFEVAGSDKVFYPAIAAIKNGNIIVHAPQVKKPVAVRYAFKDFVVAEVFSTEGLPVSTFRSDEW